MRLLDALQDRRDRLLASERFRRWAAHMPLTRRYARRQSRALFDLTAGFVYSQVLLAVVRLGVLDLLRAGPLPGDLIGRRVGLPPAEARRLLEAASSLGLIRHRAGGRYGLGRLGAPLVGNGEVTAMIEHNALLYRDLADPVALLRGGGRGSTELGAYWPYARHGHPSEVPAEAVAEYSALMTRSLALTAGEVLEHGRLDRHRQLLDVGGGEGAFLELAGARFPDLAMVLFDLPAVAERGRARLAAAGLADRARVVAGDFLIDPLPLGADVVTLIRVLHDHDDEQVRGLLASCRTALPVGGRILVAEPLDGMAGGDRVGAAYFGLYLLAMGGGRARSAREYAGLLREAGFGRIRRLSAGLPVQTGLVEGVRL